MRVLWPIHLHATHSKYFIRPRLVKNAEGGYSFTIFGLLFYTSSL